MVSVLPCYLSREPNPSISLLQFDFRKLNLTHVSKYSISRRLSSLPCLIVIFVYFYGYSLIIYCYYWIRSLNLINLLVEWVESRYFGYWVWIFWAKVIRVLVGFRDCVYEAWLMEGVKKFAFFSYSFWETRFNGCGLGSMLDLFVYFFLLVIYQ